MKINTYEEFKDFIEQEDPLIVIDSSVFLDYYRYSSQTSKEILEVLESVKDDIWIPHQVYYEFIKNHKKVKKEQHNKYKNILKDINKYTDEFNHKLTKLFNKYGKYDFPKINELKNKINSCFDKSQITEAVKTYHEEIENELRENQVLMNKNEIYDFINNLKTSNKVGDSFSGNRILEIIEEGIRRFQYNIPPGYKDDGKKTEENGSTDPKRPYGDLIIWKSILDVAKEDGVSVVFTTSDSKEDWWALDESKNILHPREELISEFKDFVENKTHLMMLPMKEFTEYFSRLKQTTYLYAQVELNALSIIKNQISYSTDEIISSLIHDGELQWFMQNGLLEDVEDFEINDVTLYDNNIDFDEDKASIIGILTLKGSAIITEAFGTEYSEGSAYDLEISAEFSIELELNIEDKNYEVDNFELDNIKVHYAAPQEDIFDDEQCVICERRSGALNLFPNSPICSECSTSGDYFICTNCSTVYKNEDYNGDGEYCQNCIEN
ncbi:PIN domain-containing protein [Bacillus halotolerans]|uniref:PIN domain-containing protein n=1 Tax=Bacillus halotolerans TaxID=260554 RepID=UPI00192C59D6|nr:PIN domain-containing protein [Bacillus halotolerans]MBL4969035.1 DUF4935 domain-containing protein [Bacillus halotolerans]MBL4973098.1 DUF4935 domain-containing protein [Bacillus halotolerans]